MNAAVLHTLGQPPRFEQFPDPTPGAGEAIVHLAAAALKPVDKQMDANYAPAARSHSLAGAIRQELSRCPKVGIRERP